MLPQKAIEEFKRIYRKQFGKDLPEKEAQYRANNLFGLYKAVFGRKSQKIPLKVRENY